MLSWSTASEIDNDYFTVEHSADGIHFTALDNVDGAGTSSTVRNYYCMDEFPFTGNNYYRLIQTDFDGTQKTFSSISINNDKAAPALSIQNIFPNPSQGSFSVTYNSMKKGIVHLEIRNPEGRLMHSEWLPASAGKNQIECNKNTLLPKGIYFITLSQGNDKTETKRIVKY